jgi:hypothetical protein
MSRFCGLLFPFHLAKLITGRFLLSRVCFLLRIKRLILESNVTTLGKKNGPDKNPFSDGLKTEAN